MFTVVRRAVLRGSLCFLRKLSEKDETRAIHADCLSGLLRSPATVDWDAGSVAAPFDGLGAARAEHAAALRHDPIFVTGRFRSGSTLVWNLFRALPEMTAFYEPFNERRWFDPATRGDRVDQTHRNVSEYWKEYEGLTGLDRYYDEDWIRRDLYMPAAAWKPNMKRYIESMIEQSPGRPVLQFNRIDFRLPWLRANFPHAALLHVYRHPRDQWCSFLGPNPGFTKEGTFEEYARHDGFYLIPWILDLKYHFPFLDPRTGATPYQLFYYLWKLSYLCGRKYADLSIAMEDLVETPMPSLARLTAAVGLDGADLDRLSQVIAKPKLRRWNAFAPDAWFVEQESLCETTLADFFGTDTNKDAVADRNAPAPVTWEMADPGTSVPMTKAPS